MNGDDPLDKLMVGSIYDPKKVAAIEGDEQKATPSPTPESNPMNSLWDAFMKLLK